MFHMKPSRPLAERIRPETNSFRAASLSDAEFPCGLRIPCDLVRGRVRGRSAAAQDAFHPTKLAATHVTGILNCDGFSGEQNAVLVVACGYQTHTAKSRQAKIGAPKGEDFDLLRKRRIVGFHPACLEHIPFELRKFEQHILMNRVGNYKSLRQLQHHGKEPPFFQPSRTRHLRLLRSRGLRPPDFFFHIFQRTL